MTDKLRQAAQQMLEAATDLTILTPREWQAVHGLKINALRAALAEQPAEQEPVHGDVLPPVGSRVYIRHGRDDDAHACTVTGYYAWSDLGGSTLLHRVFVRLVYEGTTVQQARLLRDCYPTAEAAIAAPEAPQPAKQPLTDGLNRNLESAAGLALEVLEKHRQMKGEYPMGMLGVRAAEELKEAFREIREAAHGIGGQV